MFLKLLAFYNLILYNRTMAKVQARSARRRYKNATGQTACFLPPDDESIRAPAGHSRSHRVKDENPPQCSRKGKKTEKKIKDPHEMKRIREELISTISTPTLGLNFVWAFLFFVFCCWLFVVDSSTNCILLTAN